MEKHINLKLNMIKKESDDYRFHDELKQKHEDYIMNNTSVKSAALL